jgi:uncharacterized membrane protein
MREIMLMLHFIGLAMGVGTSFVMMMIGRIASKMAPEDRAKFGLNILVLRRLGQTGLALLIITGLYLMTPFWKTLEHMPYMIAKLILVVILVVVVTIIDLNARKVVKGIDPGVNMQKNARIGPLGLLLGLTIIIMAVLSFH